MKTLVSAGKIAEQMGLGYSTVIEWTNEGIIPAIIIQHGKKRKYLYNEDKVEAKFNKFKNNSL